MRAAPIFRGLAWTAFAALALTPFVLLAGAELLGAPAETARIAAWVGATLERIGWIALVAAVAAVLFYPPALPALRLGFHRLRRRLGVDTGRLYGAEQRLRDFETAEDHREVARLRLELGDPQRALPHAVRAVEIEPASLAHRLLYARVALELGAVDEARTQLEALVAKDENLGYGDALALLARARRRGGDLEGAVEALERHARHNGPRRDLAAARARLLERLERKDDAVAAWRDAARPPVQGERLDVEQSYARACARMALLGRGRPPSQGGTP